MKSRSEFELDSLPVPTPEDIAALERADRRAGMSHREYLDFLEKLTAGLSPRDRRNSDTDEPFEL